MQLPPCLCTEKCWWCTPRRKGVSGEKSKRMGVGCGEEGRDGRLGGGGCHGNSHICCMHRAPPTPRPALFPMEQSQILLPPLPPLHKYACWAEWHFTLFYHKLLLLKPSTKTPPSPCHHSHRFTKCEGACRRGKACVLTRSITVSLCWSGPLNILSKNTVCMLVKMDLNSWPWNSTNIRHAFIVTWSSSAYIFLLYLLYFLCEVVKGHFIHLLDTIYGWCLLK